MSPMKCPGRDPMFLKPQDIAEVPCPECGKPIEFWPDELVRKCRACGHRLANPEASLKCLEWCKYAAQCISVLRGEGEEAMAPLKEELIIRMESAFDGDADKIRHTLEVLDLAERIGREAGADPIVIVPAAIFHDVGRAAAQERQEQVEHGLAGRQQTEELLSGIALPASIKKEILDIVEHHHDRDKMNCPNGSAVFDADVIVNLRKKEGVDRGSELDRKALTKAGKRIGREHFSQ